MQLLRMSGEVTPVCDSVSFTGACTPVSSFGSYSPLGGGFGEGGS